MEDSDLTKTKEKLLNLAFQLGLLTPEEYAEQFEGKYVDPIYGTDSFFPYLESALVGVKHFGTLNEEMIKDAKMLREKFGVTINDIE